MDQPANRARQHHADQVVAGEHDRLLERARRDDDALRPVPVEHGSAVHGDETALPDPERACRGQHLDSGQLRELSRTLVDEHDAGPLGRRGERSRAACFRSADDQDARAPVLHVVAPRVPASLVDAAEPGEVPQDLLVQRPRAARVDHRPVVEADRRERPADLVGEREHVEIEVPPHVLLVDLCARARRLDADADVRNPVHGHHAIRAVAGAAEQAARAVVLERARERAQAGRVERGAERVALVALDPLLAEAEDDGAMRGRSSRSPAARAS